MQCTVTTGFHYKVNSYAHHEECVYTQNSLALLSGMLLMADTSVTKILETLIL